MALVKVLHRRGLRPDAEAVHGDDFLAVGQVDDRGRHAEKAAIVHVDNVQRQAHGHAGVNGVAAVFQDFQTGHGGAGVAGGNHAVDTLHQGAIAG